jgi:NADP-dependent 3-hydroxy acid dehydrogenase YdfG
MGKTAVITGASSGIGKAVANALLEYGINTVVNGRSGASVYNDCEKILVNTEDLLEKETPGHLLDAALERYGNCELLFVNAGMLESGTIEEIDIDRVCEMARLKVESSFRLIYTFARHFKKKNKGHIFITSSVLGTKVREGVGAYAGCNFALEALAEDLRMQLSDTDVKLTVLEPGLVETRLHRNWPKAPKEILGIDTPLAPEDIAESVIEILAKPDYVRIPRYMILPKGHRL